MIRDLETADRLLRSWAGFVKAMGLHLHVNGELADYDDELADEVYRTACETMEWRDDPR